MTFSKLNKQSHQESQDNIDSPFQDEAIFSEAETIHAANALESRLVSYEDESPFLQAFANEETPVEQSQWEDSEADYTELDDPENLADWEESSEMEDENSEDFVDQVEPSVGEQEGSESLTDEYEDYELEEDVNSEDFIDQSEPSVVKQEVSKDLIDEYEDDYELEEDGNSEEFVDKPDLYFAEQDEAENLTEWDETYVTDMENLVEATKMGDFEDEQEFPRFIDRSLPSTVAPRVLTYSEVIDKRISVPAQHALVRLSKKHATNSDAVRMLEAVKSGHIAGIYCVNWKFSTKRAERFGKTWWTVIPRGEDAVLMLDPDNISSGPPLIAFRRELDSRKDGCGSLKTDKTVSISPSRLDKGLIRVWHAYIRYKKGEIGPCIQHETNNQEEIPKLQEQEDTYPVVPSCCLRVPPPLPRVRHCCLLAPYTYKGKKLNFHNFIDPYNIGIHGTSTEKVGTIYTCRAGFIDLGHLRDLCDLTHYVYDQINYCKGVPTNIRTTHGVAGITKKVPRSDWIRVAGAISYDDAFGYEIYTYDLYSTCGPGVKLCRDMTLPGGHHSSFSPEDLCSNYLGTLLAKKVIIGGSLLQAKTPFNDQASAELNRLLHALDARPLAETHQAFNNINGCWVNYPLMLLRGYLKRRNFTRIPWYAGLNCDASSPPTWVTRSYYGSVASYYTYTHTYGRNISKANFTSELSRIKADARSKYGVHYDKPVPCK